jgi:hypothetical protein
MRTVMMANTSASSTLARRKITVVGSRSRESLVDLRLRRAHLAGIRLHQPRHHGHEGFMVAEQLHRRERLRFVFRQNAPRFARECERRIASAAPKDRAPESRALGGDAVDVGIGGIELLEDRL